MTDIETIVKNSLLYTADLCLQNNLTWKMKNKSIYIFNESINTCLVKVTFKSKTIEVMINNNIKVINLEVQETSQEIVDRFKKKLLTSLQSQLRDVDQKVSSLREDYTRSKEIKDLRIKLLYHLLKITNNKQSKFSATLESNVIKLFKKHSGCMTFIFYKKSLDYQQFMRTPSEIKESELDEMIEDFKYTFIEGKKYYSDWELKKVSLENKKVNEVFNDILSDIRQFDKSVENKKLKHSFTETTYI